MIDKSQCQCLSMIRKLSIQCQYLKKVNFNGTLNYIVHVCTTWKYFASWTMNGRNRNNVISGDSLIIVDNTAIYCQWNRIPPCLNFRTTTKSVYNLFSGMWAKVNSIQSDSPAGRSGIRSHDFIKRINGRLVFHMTPAEVDRLINSSGNTLFLDIERWWCSQL